MNQFQRYIFYLICTLPAMTRAQSEGHSEQVAVQARPYGDSITLRWAPLSYDVWQAGNAHGYIIERYTLSRDGRVLDTPTKVELNGSPLRPQAEAGWINLVRSDKHAAIAAQALFGESFNVDLGKSGVVEIVNKVRENEQRFAFALWCSDMSIRTAQMSGLRYVDKNVVHGEKYLYRIIIEKEDSLRGSVFVGADDAYALPPPTNVRADENGQAATIRWDKSFGNKYSAYVLERSADGKTFKKVGDEPIVTLEDRPQSPSRFEYAVDSLPDNSSTYYYRVRGFTPFGELSQPSEVVSVQGQSIVTSVPQITAGESIDNKSIRLNWEFDLKQEQLIKGFDIRRSNTPTPEPNTIVAGLDPSARNYRDDHPAQTNYYRVVAVDRYGKEIPSPLFYAELIDSIPPSDPVGLSGKIDEQGIVRLTWQANTDKDLDGYRIYRANFGSEEPYQVTTGPVKTTTFIDSVDLNTLDKSLYYCVMAVDINQNHSGLSKKLQLSLPDKVKPQPPIFLPSINTHNSVTLRWLTGGSADVESFHVFRKGNDSIKWLLIGRVPNTEDSVTEWTDENAPEGERQFYTVIALDHAGNESEPASAISAARLINHQLEPVQWKAFNIDKAGRKVTLRWSALTSQVIEYRIYKSIDKTPLVLFRTLPPESVQYVDQIIPGKEYQYRIMAMLTKGRLTSLSEPITVKY